MSLQLNAQTNVQEPIPHAIPLIDAQQLAWARGMVYIAVHAMRDRGVSADDIALIMAEEATRVVITSHSIEDVHAFANFLVDFMLDRLIE